MTPHERHAALGLVLAGLLAACGGPSPQADAMRQQAGAPQEASLRIGDLIVRANAVQAATLGEAVARQYGVDRSAGTVMLLVGVRREGADTQETSVPARVGATAVDLLGRRQAPEMREVRSGDSGSRPGDGFIDYVGSFRIAAPETLRFDVEVVAEGGQRMTLQFNRDFFAR
ncbi:MAG: DUF4426 domain-containing protein [Luteimonas sp.]